MSLNERENSGFRWTYPLFAVLVRSKSLCFSSFDSPTSIDAYFRASKRAKLIVLPEFHHCRRRLAAQLSIALRNKVQVTFDWYQGFFRVRREFSAEGRDSFGRRPTPRAANTIKTWQKPETALEKYLAPRVDWSSQGP